MIDADLLAQYHDWHHVEQALRSVLRRLDKASEFKDINVAMRTLATAGNGDFRLYYPELRRQLKDWNAFDAIAVPRSS